MWQDLWHAISMGSQALQYWGIGIGLLVFLLGLLKLLQYVKRAEPERESANSAPIIYPQIFELFDRLRQLSALAKSKPLDHLSRLYVVRPDDGPSYVIWFVHPRATDTGVAILRRLMNEREIKRACMLSHPSNHECAPLVDLKRTSQPEIQYRLIDMDDFAMGDIMFGGPGYLNYERVELQRRTETLPTGSTRSGVTEVDAPGNLQASCSPNVDASTNSSEQPNQDEPRRDPVKAGIFPPIPHQPIQP